MRPRPFAPLLAWLSLSFGWCIFPGPYISPMEGYTIESQQCKAKPDPEEARRCQAMVEHKYYRYLHEGDYPPPEGHSPPTFTR